jgi:Fibronectin type III domain.
MIAKWKKIQAFCFSILIISVSFSGIQAAPQEAKAAGYGISNPRTDANGVSTWDCIYFGDYYQSSSDKKEKIKWRVLYVSGEDAFLLSDKNLDSQPFHTKKEAVTWETCSLRTWLNEDFYRAAFNEKEQSAIRTTDVVTENGIDKKGTSDKVYLLSVAEAANPSYGFSSSLDDSETRQAKNTEYAKGRGALTDDAARSAGNGWWWLRSSGENLTSVVNVGYYGKIFKNGYDPTYKKDAVRPVLHLDLSSDLWSKAGTVSMPGGNIVKKDPVRQSTGTMDDEKKQIQDLKKIVAPGRVKKLSAKNKKKQTVTLSWRKIAGVKGYQIQFAVNKKFKKKTGKFTNKTKYTLKKLKKKKTYYFRVRAYRQNGGKKLYGKWSNTKKIKIRK